MSKNDKLPICRICHDCYTDHESGVCHFCRLPQITWTGQKDGFAIGYVTVTPEAKRYLMEKFGLEEGDFEDNDETP